MKDRLRTAAYVAAVLALAGVWAWEAVLRPAPALAGTAEAIARGHAVVRARCQRCHAALRLDRRVTGWTVEQAYDALGRLPRLRPGMPAFAGTEDERRDLAVYLAALGAGKAPPP